MIPKGVKQPRAVTQMGLLYKPTPEIGDSHRFKFCEFNRLESISVAVPDFDRARARTRARARGCLRDRLPLDKSRREFYLVLISAKTIIQEEEHEEYP